MTNESISNNNSAAAAARPSTARRQKLNDDLGTPSISSFFPITRYYDLAQKLYRNVWKEVHNAEKRDLDAMYVYAKRYCMFIVDVLPAHPYYGAPGNRALQAKHTQQVQKCIQVLETVADRMDEECLERQRLARLARERQQQEKARQQQERARRDQQAIDAWILAQQQQQQQQKAATTTTATTALNQSAVQQSALDKLKLLQPGGATPEVATGVPVAPPPSRKRSSTRYGLMSDDSDTDDDHSVPSQQQQQPYGVPLPPPLLPPTSELLEEDKKEDEPSAAVVVPSPPPPPPYQAVVSHPPKYHSFFGPDDDEDSATIPTTQPPQYQSLPQPPKKQQPPPAKKPKQPMRQQQELYRNLYAQYQRQGRIQVLPLGTYQGRVGASTNGCTVISALVAARHLNSSNNGNNNGNAAISDATIQNVIDQQCGPFLREIRAKLGLGGAALIIPSDVHDHLVDAGILKQEYFCGAAGGNIVDPDHSGEFLKLLTADSTKRKAAATLFFREHVVSIVKFPAPNSSSNNGSSSTSQFHYDLIDSLPSPSTGRATRTRCADADALQVLLQWYASRKFADHHCDYIDRNAWDDSLADLDPRVFQGFVWSR